jgi:hypothetical protein
MASSLNLKSPEVHALATELARLRKTSVTAAVLEAVRAELEREQRLRARQGLGAQLNEIARRCADRIGGTMTSTDHASLLYDDRGLPR